MALPHGPCHGSMRNKTIPEASEESISDRNLKLRDSKSQEIKEQDTHVLRLGPPDRWPECSQALMEKSVTESQD